MKDNDMILDKMSLENKIIIEKAVSDGEKFLKNNLEI